MCALWMPCGTVHGDAPAASTPTTTHSAATARLRQHTPKGEEHFSLQKRRRGRGEGFRRRRQSTVRANGHLLSGQFLTTTTSFSTSSSSSTTTTTN